MGLLRRLFKLSSRDYQLRALVSSRALTPAQSWPAGLHVFCDLDKTYLETEFESWIKMAKIPFESPHDKITVPGASEVMELLRWAGPKDQRGNPETSIHFVSSSPPQLRLALDGKLTLDRLEWASDTFKNQSYNLRMARIDLLRHHIAYKTKAILDLVSRLPEGSSVLMIGDNAEFDAFIYSGVRLFVEGRMTFSQLLDWLRGARVEESVISQLAGSAWKIAENVRVAGVFIRSLPGYEEVSQTRLAGTWMMFDSWLQVALELMREGYLGTEALAPLIRAFHNLHGVPMAHLRWCLYRLNSDVEISAEIRARVDQVLADVATVGASGPSRRMLAWDLDRKIVKKTGECGNFSAKDESAKWYEAIEHNRAERKSRRKR